jgi:hypothetical protein
MFRKFALPALLALSAVVFAETLTLDGAIVASSESLIEAIPEGSRVAVVSVSAQTERLSAYIAEELNGAFLDSKRLVVVERKDLELVRGELRFQTSGEVSDDSAQSVGKLLGAAVIVTGSIDESWRLRLKAVSIEEGRILAASAVDVERSGKAAVLAGVPGAALPSSGFEDPSSWSTFTDDSGSGATDILLSVERETIGGKEYGVVTVETEIPSEFRYAYAAWAAIPDEATLGRLRATKGIRFKVLGDGKRYSFRVHTAGVTDGDWYSYEFATQKGVVVDVAVPYKRMCQSMQKSFRFDRSSITGISFLARKSTSCPIKIFDIRPY